VPDLIPEPGPEFLSHTDDRLLWLLGKAGDEWGRLGVALAAAHMSDPAVVAARLRQAFSERLAPEEPVEQLRRQLDEANRNTAEAREDADRYATAITTLERERDAARAELDACRAQQLRQARTIAEQPPLDSDPRRPHLDSWPDDAVLLRYRELRHLVSLHLDRYCDPRSAAAMREGDVPLRLAEVLDR
jgi:hypothetical protein